MSPIALGAMVLLLLLNGFFVAAEFAFTAASRHSLATRTSRPARAAVAAIDDLSFTLAGAQLGITIASLLLGAVSEPAVAAVIEASIGTLIDIPEATLHTISLIVALMIVVYLHMVIGEMAPKNVAISDPERSSLVLALPFRLYTTALRPIIWALNELANVGLRMVGVDPADTKEAHTADDLAHLISAGRRDGVVEDFAHKLLTGAMDLWSLRAENIMVPRPDVVAVEVTSTPRQIEELVAEHGHSRIPVYDGDIDNVVGFVHAKDLLGLPDDQLDQPLPRTTVRPLLAVPESGRVSDVLEQMRGSRSHLALVVGEYGGTAGIVSLEDIVEEVVGEIRDESDTDVAGVRRLSARRFELDGSLRLADLRRATGIEMAAGEYDTVGGLVMSRVGRIPVAGDRVDDGMWRIQVRSMDGLRVGEVDLVSLARPADRSGEAGETSPTEA